MNKIDRDVHPLIREANASAGLRHFIIALENHERVSFSDSLNLMSEFFAAKADGISELSPHYEILKKADVLMGRIAGGVEAFMNVVLEPLADITQEEIDARNKSNVSIQEDAQTLHMLDYGNTFVLTKELRSAVGQPYEAKMESIWYDSIRVLEKGAWGASVIMVRRD